MSSETQDDGVEVLQQVVSIVSAYVSHNAMRAVELPDFIGAVHASIRQLSKNPAAVEAKPAENPAVPVKRSVSKEFIVCLECGKKFKSLRRHLSSFHALTPDEYRAKWGLASDYPMVAPAYSATRSQLARDSGLGQIGRGAEAPGASVEEAPSTQPVAEAAESLVAESLVAESFAANPRGTESRATESRAAEPSVAEAPAAEPAAAAAADEAPNKAKRGRPKKVAA